MNVQVQGPYPQQWAPFQATGLLHAWQISHQISSVSIMRVYSWELPLSAIPLCQLLPSHLGPPRPMLPLTCMSKAVLTVPLERSACPYQRSLLSFSRRSRSSMPSRASSSVDLMVAVSCGLTLQISLIIALSFRCRHWRQGLVTGQVPWHGALRFAHTSCTHGHVSWEKGGGKRELVSAPWTSSRQFSHVLWLKAHNYWEHVS